MSTPPFNITDEMVLAGTRAIHHTDCDPRCDETLTTEGRYGRQARAVVEAVAPLIAEQVLRQHAELIRSELVCCDVYETLGPVLQERNLAGENVMVDDENTRGHQICYWGEAAAMLVEPRAGDGGRERSLDPSADPDSPARKLASLHQQPHFPMPSCPPTCHCYGPDGPFAQRA